MFNKGNKLHSILGLKCPRCHQGKFLESHPYNLSSFNQVKDECPKCGLKYKIEPSFYYGSMYVSYGVGIAVAVAVYVLTVLFKLNLSLAQLFGLMVGVLLLSMPWIGAVSKAIWANIFMKYDDSVAQQVRDQNS
ncbi:DUF983 domain-containing protein [Cytophaga sp. FL35]|uniref:DUF983 domain-containing protein n=1 Tax=Cytophaga sp. FL35 TaxID=1904456 RepID=UPI001653676C|nr:DUF983 domain-containing protein [Cytophaga sp. FL35]MBC6996980.1 DUF983 domain-containing protein [Cytophaga sp. FL35]